MAISTIAETEHLHNVHSGSPQTTKRNPPQITKFYSMIFKQQLTDISTVLNNTGNTTKLLTSFNALDIAQQKVLLSSSLLSEKQKEQCITMATLSAANTKYTAEQLVKATGISTETLANWGLIESTDALTISELAQRAASDAQAKAVLDKIIAQNAEAVANGKIIASNTALTASEGGATLATGAFTTAIKANIKAMITWMTTTPLGWLTMLVGGVFLAVKAYDALTISVKEQKEKMEDSLSAYKDAKSELSNITTELENQEQVMDDLLVKEKLTYAEQGQLEELQAITRELRIQKDLVAKEEGRTQKEVAKDASDLFNKQFGKYDISEDAISEYQNNANITGNNAILISDENDISSMIAGYRQFNNLLDEAYGSESQEDIDHFKSLTEGLKNSIFETAQELQEQQSNIADYYNTIKDIPHDNLTTEQKGIIDSYNSISDAIELIYQQLDSNTWKSMQIESVFDTEGIEKTKKELIEMVKAGEFDESTLQSYPKLSEALKQNKVSASELRNELEALAEAEGNVKGDTFNDKYPVFSSFSDTDFGTRIQHITDMFNEGTISHKEYFDALQSEIENFDASNFTDSIEDMNKASAQFFVDSMQQTADGLSGLINAFDNGEMSISEYLEGYLAIGNTLSTLTDNLQENSAAWNEHGEAISEAGNTALDDTQDKLNSAMSIIESYQDSIYSLEQIMNDAVTVGSDEFTAHANVIAEDLYHIIQTGGEMADTVASALGTTTSEIAQSLTENVSNQEIACQAIMANTNNAITDMADSIGQLFDTLGNAISNFKVDLTFGVSDFSLKDVALGLLGVQELPEIKFSLSASGESLDQIGSAISSFGKTIASNYTPQTIELEDFHFGSTDAAKDRNYSPSSGITKNYENALDKIKDATTSTSDTVKSEFEEMVDFFERRVDELDNALSLLKTSLDNVSGSFAKNNLIDVELGITEEKFNNYTDALAMYTQKANEALSKLPADIAAKVKDGAVALTDFIGDGTEDVVEAIKEYESWADKISDCKQELEELKTAIRQLELEKFNNIMDDFKNQFDLRDDSKDLISKQIDLLKEAGELIGESFYTAQIDQSKKQLELLENEKAQLVDQMSSAISSGRVKIVALPHSNMWAIKVTISVKA